MVDRQVERVELAVDRQRRHAEVGALDGLAALELAEDRLAVSIGTAKPMPTLPVAAAAGLDLRVDADHAAGGVDQRPAGVARVDRRVGLDDVLDREAVGRRDLPLQRGDDAGRQRAVQAERVADRDRRVADLDVLGRAQRQRLEVQALGVDLQQREVGRRVRADDLGLDRLLVGELDRDRVLGRAVDDVVVGEDVAGGVDDEARSPSPRSSARRRTGRTGCWSAG